MNCVDWLGAAVTRAGRIRLPDRRRRDDGGTLRVVTPAIGFDQFVERPFHQLRPYVSRDRNAALHTFHVLTEIVRDLPRAPDREVVQRAATALYATARTTLPDERDRDELERAWTLFRRAGVAGEERSVAGRS
jgi:uncharacterized membrane protein